MKPADKPLCLAGAVRVHFISMRWNVFICVLNLVDAKEDGPRRGSLYRVEDVIARDGKLMTKSGAIVVCHFATPSPARNRYTRTRRIVLPGYRTETPLPQRHEAVIRQQIVTTVEFLLATRGK